MNRSLKWVSVAASVLSVVLQVVCVGADERPGGPQSNAAQVADAQPEAEHPPDATQRDAAEKHFQVGLAFQKLEDFQAAIVQYRESLRLFPTRNALFNLANCLRATHRYTEALKSLRRLRKDYGSQLPQSMQRAVEQHMQQLLTLTAMLRVEVVSSHGPVRGARLLLDGQPIGETPLDPVRVDLGEHEFEVRHEDYETARVSVDVSSPRGAKARVLLEPPARAGSGPSTEKPTSGRNPTPRTSAGVMQDSEPSSAGNTLAWASLSVGAALLLGGGATGVWALSVDNDLEDSCVDGHCPRSKESDISRLGTLATTTNILVGTGLAATATGAVLLLLDGSADSEPTRELQAPVSLQFGRQYAGIQVRRPF